MISAIKNILVSTPLLSMVAFAIALVDAAKAGLDAKKILLQTMDEVLPALA